jgi:hypothetical protein
VRYILVACLLTLTTAASTNAGPLAPLLAAVSRNARCSTPTRADVTFVRGERTSTAVLLCSGHHWYLETDTGFRALSHPHKQVVLRDGRAVRAGVRTLIPNTDWLLEELPFDGARLTFPQVNDDGPEGVVVAGESMDPSLYVLLVRTIDPARAVVTDSKYYKDDIATLMKVRHDADFVQVGGHWRPGRIELEDYVERSITRMTLAWRTVPELPRALFTPAGLLRPSGLTLPAAK